MNFYGRRFNLYLLLTVALTLVSGCAMFDKKNKQAAALRIHIESGANATGVTQDIKVMRSEPVAVNIMTSPIITEANIVGAKLVDDPGGFAVQLKFDQQGGWALEEFSATNPGKHFAIFGQWGEKLANGRWLAAPIIRHRIADGELTFTPDASRTEAEEWVKGLNLVAKKNLSADK